MTPQKSALQRTRRLLPFVVLGLGAIAGLMLAAVLVARPEQPTGQATPPQTAAASSMMPSPVPSSGASQGPSMGPSPTYLPSARVAPTGPAQLAWTAGRAQPGRVSGVVRFGDRWIAGGNLGVGPTTRPGVWTSIDGITWSEPIVLGPEPIEEGGFWPRYWINGFGEWDGDLFAYGWNGVGCCDGGYPMLWRSADGDAWDVVEIDGTAFGDEFHFPQTSVVRPDGSLAVVSVTGLGGGTAMFLGPDIGSTEIHHVPAAGESFGLSAFAASPDLLIVAGTVPGEVVDDQTVFVPVVATSRDGKAWTTVDPPDSGGTVGDVAWDEVGGRFVAVGTDADGLPVAWLTADGTSWTPIALGDEPTYMHRVTVADGLIVASGESGPGFQPTPGDTIVWSSHDGASWWYATVLEGRVGTVEAATPDSAVLITHRYSESDDTWLSLVGTPTAGD